MINQPIIIAALDLHGVIGIGDKLPWKLPKDMKFFSETTKNHAVIMGRKTYESIPEKYRPLPNRRNIILSRQEIEFPGCTVFRSMTEAIASVPKDEKIFIAGGAEIYKLAMAFAGSAMLTEVHTHIENKDNVYYPMEEAQKYDWQEISRVENPVDEKHGYSFDFVVYIKK